MTKQTTEAKASRKPQFYAYQVIETQTDGAKGRWNQIGAYFAHDDGKGGTLMLDLLPIGFDGRIVLRAPKDKE